MAATSAHQHLLAFVLCSCTFVPPSLVLIGCRHVFHHLKEGAFPGHGTVSDQPASAPQFLSSPLRLRRFPLPPVPPPRLVSSLVVVWPHGALLAFLVATSSPLQPIPLQHWQLLASSSSLGGHLVALSWLSFHHRDRPFFLFHLVAFSEVQPFTPFILPQPMPLASSSSTDVKAVPAWVFLPEFQTGISNFLQNVTAGCPLTFQAENVSGAKLLSSSVSAGVPNLV